MLPDRVKVVYVAGMGRSGSTFLGTLLGQLDGFFYVGEFSKIARCLTEGSICGSGEPVAECPVWRAILADAFPEGAGEPDLSPLRMDFSLTQVRGMFLQWLRARGLTPGSSRHDRSRAAFAALLQAVRKATGSRVIVDSSKSPGFGFFLDQIDCVDLYLVHLVRDPRAVAHSRVRTGERQGFALRPAPPGFAVVWDIWNTAIELAWRRGRYIRLRYEDLVREPEAALERIAALAGERAAGLPRISGESVELAPTHSVAGNRCRFQTGEVQLKLDDEWTTATRLTAANRRVVTALTWPWRIRYGYGGTVPTALR